MRDRLLQWLGMKTLYAATRTEMDSFELAEKRELTASNPGRENAMREGIFFISSSLDSLSPML